ncbi:MAG: hypothetical protein ACTSUC_01835 [Promethearchaeota archaeon]
MFNRPPLCFSKPLVVISKPKTTKTSSSIREVWLARGVGVYVESSSEMFSRQVLITETCQFRNGLQALKEEVCICVFYGSYFSFNLLLSL